MTDREILFLTLGINAGLILAFVAEQIGKYFGKKARKKLFEKP